MDACSICSVDVLDKGIIHVPVPEETEQEDARFYHIAQKGVQFKIYELFISGIFDLIFWDHGWPQVNETAESETTDKEDYCT